MLLTFLIIFVGTMVLAEVPPYIKVCGRRNPKLNECVKNTVDGLRYKLRTGIPELNVPSVEPLMFKSFPLFETEQIKSQMKNVKIYGLSNFEIRNLDVNLENKQITMEIFLDKIVVDADFNVTAELVFPIQGHGPIHITAEGVGADLALQYKIYKKHGREYLFFSAMRTKLNIKDLTSEFKPDKGRNNETLQMIISAALDEGRQEILNIMTPKLEKLISERVLQASNKICKHFTYAELFPDRE